MKFRLIDAETKKVIGIIDTPTTINDQFPNRTPIRLSPWAIEFLGVNEKTKAFLKRTE